MKTEAIVIGADGQARLQEVSLPPMGDTRVRVATLISGVSCGTEADLVSGRATYLKRPFISGYQAVGKIIEVGRQVSTLVPGDLVVTNGGGLWEMPHLAGGSHARESISEAKDVVKLNPATPSFSTAAYASLAAVGYEALLRMKLQPGKVLAVFGLGMLGQLAGRIGQLQGLRVIGVNRSAWRREIAQKLGFDAVCEPDLAALRKTAEALGCGEIKFALDTTGSQTVFDLALDALGSFGELSLDGYYPEKFTVNFDTCHGKNLTLHNPVGWGNCLPPVVKMIEEGALNVEALVRHRIRPGEITGFYSDLVKSHADYLGAIIEWTPIQTA